jgi:hypothetical protein
MSDMVSIDNEIAELRAVVVRVAKIEAENAALRAEVAALKNMQGRRTAIPVHRPVERELTVTTPAPVSTFKMPTLDQLAKLLDIVGRHFPSLLSVDGPAFEGTSTERHKQYCEQFEGAFLAIGNMKRKDRPDTTVYLSYHIEVAESVLKSFGRPSMTIRGNAFLAACLAHFDVPVSSIGRQHEGIVTEIGLHQYVGRPAGDAWRRIIEGAAPREVAVQRPPAAQIPARVQYF